MRTWKQGRIGKITFPDSSTIFIKCLKYPIAQFFEKYYLRKQELVDFQFEIKVEKSILKYIEQIGQQILSKEEKVERSFYTINTKSKEITIHKGAREIIGTEEEIKGMEQEQLWNIKQVRERVKVKKEW